MPPITTPLVALFVLCLALEVPAQTSDCPAGERQVQKSPMHSMLSSASSSPSGIQK